MNDNEIRILIIDYQEDSLVSMRSLLEKQFSNIKILSVHTVENGLSIAKEIKPHLVLINIQIPGTESFQFCKTMKSDDILKLIPVVFMTPPATSQSDRIKAIEVGCDAFLELPVKENEFLSLIKDMRKVRHQYAKSVEEIGDLNEFVHEKEEMKDYDDARHLLEALQTEYDNRIASEKALKEAQHIAHLGSWEYDIINDTIFISREAFAIGGIDRDGGTVPYKVFLQTIVPEDLPFHQAAYNKAIATGDNLEIEYRVTRTSDNRQIYVKSRGIIHRDQDGNVISIHGTIQDIDEMVRNRKELEKTKSRLENVINAANVGIWEWDLEQDSFYSNDRLANMLGYELKEYPTDIKAREAFIHPDDLPLLDKHLNEIFNRTRNQYSIEYRIRHKSGRWVWIHDLGNVVSWSPDGKPLMMAGTHQDVTERKESEIALRQSERRFRALFENAPFGYQSLDESGHFLEVNNKWLEILGYTKEEVIGSWFGDFIKEEVKEEFKKRFELFKKQGHIYSEFPMLTKDGRTIVVGFDGNIGYDVLHNFKQTHCTVRDITEINIANAKLRESEHKYRQLVDLMPLGMAVHEIITDKKDKPIDYRFISANSEFCKILGMEPDQFIGKTVLEVMPDTEDYWIKQYGKTALTGTPLRYENYSKELGRYFRVSAFRTEKRNFAVIVEDITEEVKEQKEILYLSNHDFLSGLYNRRYFVQKFKELDTNDNYPLGVMMLDINGLKIINDAFGHQAGDLALKTIADICLGIFQENNITARIGGDEFAVLLPNTDEEKIDEYKTNLKESLEHEDVQEVKLSVATGYTVKRKGSKEGLDDLLKNAENHMYRHKLAEGISNRNRAIQAILKTLTDKYEAERIHSSKVSMFCRQIGEALRLNEEDLDELELAGLYHDIGKISIPDAILNKRGRLDEEEFEIMKSHVETGYQILRAADEYTDLAIHALHHHERWDGNGYPEGMKGDKIPLFSRIICIADSYEAMIAKRPYKSKRTVEQAILELARCSGSQFDKRLARIFIEKVLKQKWPTI